MNIEDIYWHDSTILEVIENPSEDTITYVVSYPKDWDANKFEIKKIIFKEQLNHSITEGPFSGLPTILDVNKIENSEAARLNRTHIHIETNAGKRSLWFGSIESDI